MTVDEARSAGLVRSCPIEAISRLGDPTTSWVWVAPEPDGFPDWTAALKAADPYSEPILGEHVFYSLAHVGRVKWLMANGWVDPIEAELTNVADEWWWPWADGNHRLAAAILRGDTSIDVWLIDGTASDADSWLEPDRPFTAAATLL